MEKVRLGRTELMVTRTAFGALPIQRVDFDTARLILRKAYDAGINFFDTARSYSDSEEKIGYSLADVRDEIVIATKSGASTGAQLTAELETSLTNMKTDHVDILQLHNPREISGPDDADSPYAAALKAREQGKVRFIGISNHRVAVAKEAIESGLFDTLQFPLSVLSSEADLELIDLCAQADMGVIAMKAISGGLIKNIPAAFAFFGQFEAVVPIWGIQKEEELDEFLALDADPPGLDGEMLAAIDKEREELAGDFCRGCGYCMPCPVEIPINMAARMSLLIRRAPTKGLLGPEWQERMARINDCIDCGQCKERCPYDLDTPNLLKKNLADYETFLTK